MKQFIIISAIIDNFKCFSEQKEIEFGAKTTYISGDNETGKSSLADAIAYCLTGKTSEGESNFTIVPIGKEKDGISPSVALECLVKEDGKPDKPVTLFRTYKAGYNRERVFTGEYATECAINGTPCTVKAFDQWIEGNICKQDVYKLLTTVRYFTEGIASKPGNADWQQRRALLLGLLDSESLPSDIVLADSKGDLFADLKAALPRYETASAYLDFLKRQDAELTKRIADFPVKVNQQQSNMRNLPNTVAPDSIEKAIADSTDAIKKLEEENAAFRQKNKESVAAQKLQKLQELNQQKDAVVKDFRTTESNWQSRVREADSAVLMCKRACDENQAEIDRLSREIKSASEAEVGNTCDKCGQPLPLDVVNFVLKNKTNRVLAIQAMLDSALDKAADLKNKLVKAEDDVFNVKQKEPNPDLALTDKIDASITKLQQEIAGFDVNANIKDYAGRKAELERELYNNQQVKLILTLNEECEAKIVELEQQNAKDAALKSTLQQKIDSVGEFIKMKCEVAQEAVQKHFEGTGLSFDLFRFIKSTGEVKECCNILLNGTPYNDLSYSTKYIASLYIVEAFQRAYGVSLPIISDNTESIDYEGYAQSANAESQTILMFRVEENCPKCGGHSGRRWLNGTWTCQKCLNVWKKAIVITQDAE